MNTFMRSLALPAALVAIALMAFAAISRTSASNAPSTVVTLSSCLGDVNNDGVVNALDVIAVGLRLGTRVGDARYEARYDLNGDGRINLMDLAIVVSRLGTVCGQTPVPTTTATATATASRTTTPTATPTATRTSTSTATASPIATATPTPTPTSTSTATRTATATYTVTATATYTATASPTRTATATFTATIGATATATSTPRTGLPPDPGDVAPPNDDTIATDILSSTAFLYTGNDPIQTGVSAGTIELRRVAVLRGRVLDRADQPLSGVRITMLDHPEFGETFSRADGMFDMAVNGGGQLVVRYEKSGFLPSQRAVDAPWRDFAWTPDVVLVPLDSAVTTIDLTSPSMLTARGNPVTDVDGARQATVLFPAGTTASMTLPGGSTQGLSTLHMRATEFTVGDNGPQAMPAGLPASSGYTYAVEFSADEAIAAGATQINFSQAMPVYVENFIGFPVGGAVPAGYYDRQKGQWIASANGRVVQIVSITGGLADLDITGDGVTDNASSIGVTTDERARLAALYTAGQELWRVPVTHFTPWDFNWPYGPPADSIPPPNDPLRQTDPPISDPHTECGSIIGCESQTLGESVPVTGTAWDLHYQSGRTPGRTDANTIQIPVSGSAALPASLRRMRVAVTIAGRLYERTFAPAPNVTYSFVWDGKDAYRRQVLGRRGATINVHYDYTPQYYPVQGDQLSSFGRPGFSLSAAFAARGTSYISATQTYIGEVMGVWDARAAGLGGWDLDVHHAYDPGARTILFGDGRQRSADSIANIVTTVAGNGDPNSGGGNGRATDIPIQVAKIAVAPDGTFYFTESNLVRRVTPDGVMTTLAGVFGRSGYAGDGGPATLALLDSPGALAVGPDGSVYFVDVTVNGGGRVRRVAPNGIITTVAGNGSYNFCGDGGPATAACLAEPASLAVGPDGSLYIADFRSYRVRRVGTDGIINTVAGTLNCFAFGCYVPPPGDGGPATEAGLAPVGVAIGPDGSVYIKTQDTSGGSGRIRRVTPDGIISTVAGGGSYDPLGNGDGGPALSAFLTSNADFAVGPDGSLYFPDFLRIRHVSPDGIITSIAGNGVYEFCGCPDFNPGGDGGPALQVSLNAPADVALAPDGSLLIADDGNFRIRRIAPALPDISVSDVLLPSEEGRELFVFNNAGRHLRTLDALTGAVHFQFGYDADGHLASVTDASGNVTTVEHSGGNPRAIVAPGGQRTDLKVNADGWLAEATNPAGESHTMTYSPGGLLWSLTDPLGHAHAFTYDTGGRLTRDDAPGGTSTTLTRTELADGFSVTTTTALGRAHTYATHRLPLGGRRRVSTSPSGEVTTTNTGMDATEKTTFGSGATATLQFGPDPRWGILVPVMKSLTATTPGGKTRTITSTRTATLSDPANLLSLVQQTETMTEGADTTTRVYDAGTRTFTLTTPEGRTSTATLDAIGRIASYQPGPGVSPILDTYDGLGRLIAETQGPLSQTFGYDASNRMTSSTDGAGNTTTYAYNAADRMTDTTTPAGRHYGFAYDASGNMTALTMPTGAVHAFTYTPRDEVDSYTPPAGGALARTYDADREWTGLSLAGGRTLGASYDSGGRPSGRTYPEAAVGFSYAGATERLSSMSRTPLGGSTQTNTATWDADLPLTTTSTGSAAGQYSFGYDARMLLASMNLASGADTASIALTRDRDGLLTTYGPFAVSHLGPAGAASAIADAQLNVSNSYDAQGRLTRRRHAVSGATVYQLDLSFDAVGRISQRTETTAAGAETRVYAYDAEGKLTGVSMGGSSVESYSYDANGNRTSGAAAATYDAADRLTNLSGVTYAFDADGYLATRGADTFQYSTRGELISATAGGQTVTFAYDALGRRVSRTQGGATTQYLYGNPSNPFQMTASREASGVLSVYYYGTGGGVFAMDRAGLRYYVATDQAGSPRLVTDATGAVVKTLQYESYGKLVSDSNPSFPLAIGYASGLADGTTGLVHFGFRDYDAAAGRWTSRDPALYGGGGWNLYDYVDGDPVNNTDATGLWAISVNFTAYDGIGGGVGFTVGSDGIKGCLEAGVGVGGGLEAGLAEKVGNTNFTLSGIADVSAKFGPVKLGAGSEWTTVSGTKCVKGKGKISFGIPGLADVSLQGKDGHFSDVKAKVGLTELGLNSPKAEVGGVGISAKLAGKICAGTNW